MKIDNRTTLENLFQDASHKFDSKKILNRATDFSFDETFMERLKDDGLTYEMIEELKDKVPIYKYTTQLTIHGQFPVTQIERIYGYKNCIRNQNGSLGIRYNAVDVKKKIELANAIGTVGRQKKIAMPAFFRDSSSMFFRLQTTKMETMKELFDRVDTSLFYGKKHGYKAVHPWYGVFYVCDIHIGAIPAENVWKVFENWTGVKQDDLLEMESQIKLENDKQRQEIELRNQRRNEAIEANYNASINHLVELNLPEWDGELVNDMVLVTGTKNSEEQGYQYLHITAGTFGRWRYGYVVKKQYEQVSFPGLPKSVTKVFLMSKLSGRKYYVVNAGTKAPPPPQPKMCKVQGQIFTPKSEIVLSLVQYSEKAIAVFGDTMQVKDKLGAMGGRFNKYLTNPTTKQREAGWIFSKTKETMVSQFVNQTTS